MNTVYLTLTELGKLYGVSSHKVGKWLKGLALRDDKGHPTPAAGGLLDTRPSTNPGTFIYTWHEQKTTEILDNMGYPRASNDQKD